MGCARRLLLVRAHVDLERVLVLLVVNLVNLLGHPPGLAEFGALVLLLVDHPLRHNVLLAVLAPGLIVRDLGDLLVLLRVLRIRLLLRSPDGCLEGRRGKARWGADGWLPDEAVEDGVEIFEVGRIERESSVFSGDDMLQDQKEKREALVSWVS